MKISKLIEQLLAMQAKHGDVVCTAFQHEEENEKIAEITQTYFDEDDKTLHLS